MIWGLRSCGSVSERCVDAEFLAVGVRRDSLLVTLVLAVKLAPGNTVNLPEIGCGPQMCALWEIDRAITLSVSAVVSGMSDPPAWQVAAKPSDQPKSR